MTRNGVNSGQGPMLEENMRRALLMSRGDLTTFFTEPISATVLGATALLMLWSGLRALQPRHV